MKKTPSKVSLAIDPAWMKVRDDGIDAISYRWQREYEGRWGDKRIDMGCPPGRCEQCDRRRMQELMDYTYTSNITYSRMFGKTMTFQSLMETVKSLTEYKEESMYEGQSVNDSKLLKGLKKLDLDDETQLLLDAKVIDDKGNLTKEGFAFVITVLFGENKALIVDKLRAIKTADAKSKAAPAAEYEKALEAGKASA